jgi:DNA-binding protein HU-beta
MNNKEFIAQLAAKTGYTQADTQQMVRTVIAEMGAHLEEGDTLQINNFGTFEVKKRMERIVVNPGTQQRMLVPPKLILNFKPVAAIKENLKKSPNEQ